jgi:2-polyprenyl-3-methyl-5-hydroxy-6-metoxy-1,4-benzoquinol methylase
MNCPLCAGSNTALVRSLDVSEIVSRWEKEMSMDVRGEFAGTLAIDSYECQDCALVFFKPDTVAGSSELYEKLEKLDTYYMPQKWEHDAALVDMNGAANGLEVGCGFGAFVARVIHEKNIAFEGCEQNPSAVRVAQAKGTPVHLENLDELGVRCPARYDVVCAFQVLEHVTDPRGFIEGSCKLLRPGGKLILGLPNAAGFIKHLPSLYQLPPHHMSCWTAKVLASLQNLFPLRLVRIAYEPLQAYQVDWYSEAYERVVRKMGFGFLIHPWLRTQIVRAISEPRIRGLLKGESVYACYKYR